MTNTKDGANIVTETEKPKSFTFHDADLFFSNMFRNGYNCVGFKHDKAKFVSPKGDVEWDFRTGLTCNLCNYSGILEKDIWSLVLEDFIPNDMIHAIGELSKIGALDKAWYSLDELEG